VIDCAQEGVVEKEEEEEEEEAEEAERLTMPAIETRRCAEFPQSGIWIVPRSLVCKIAHPERVKS
jgi:hypothetical protein